MTNYMLTHGVREINIVGKPRRISGGYVVSVTWAADNQNMKLSDGSIHPAHRAGFTWDEPICNIENYHPFE